MTTHETGGRFCGARKRQENGTCTRPAGWGTGHAGTGHCKLHGGKTPNQAISAARQMAEEEARIVLAELGSPEVTDPFSALMQLAGEVLAWQKATAELVNRLEKIRYQGANGSEQTRAEILLYERAMDRAITVLSAIARLNIEDRLASISERQAEAVISAINAALSQAGVTGAEADAARRAAARHLRAVDSAGPRAGA